MRGDRLAGHGRRGQSRRIVPAPRRRRTTPAASLPEGTHHERFGGRSCPTSSPGAQADDPRQIGVLDSEGPGRLTRIRPAFSGRNAEVRNNASAPSQPLESITVRHPVAGRTFPDAAGCRVNYRESRD